MLGGQGIDDDDVGTGGDAGDHPGANGPSALQDAGELDEVAFEVGAVFEDPVDLRGPHRRAHVSGELGVLEQRAVEELEALDRGASGGREGGHAQTDDPAGHPAGRLSQLSAGLERRLGGDPDVAAQGRVDPAREEVDVAGDADEGIGELGGLPGGKVPRVGVEDDGVVVVGEDVEVDPLVRTRPRHGERAQPRLGEEGTARVPTGEVVGDDEDPGVLRFDRVAVHTTKSSTKSSGMEPSHTAVVIPDQPLIAWMPSSPAKRVTTQKYESLK